MARIQVSLLVERFIWYLSMQPLCIIVSIAILCSISCFVNIEETKPLKMTFSISLATARQKRNHIYCDDVAEDGSARLLFNHINN